MAWGLAEFDAEQRGKKAGYCEGLSDGISQGEHQKAIETAKNMLQKNISVEVISECTGFSLDEIEIFSK